MTSNLFIGLACIFATLSACYGCSCEPQSDKEFMCQGDFVVRAKVLSVKTDEAGVTSAPFDKDIMYTIEVQTVYKSSANVVGGVSSLSIWTPNNDGLCGITLSVGSEYAITGRDSNGKQSIESCYGLIVRWDQLSPEQEGLFTNAEEVCDPDPCNPNPCKNGGLCTPEVKQCFTTPCPQYNCTGTQDEKKDVYAFCDDASECGENVVCDRRGFVPGPQCNCENGFIPADNNVDCVEDPDWCNRNADCSQGEKCYVINEQACDGWWRHRCFQPDKVDSGICGTPAVLVEDGDCGGKCKKREECRTFDSGDKCVCRSPFVRFSDGKCQKVKCECD